MTTRLTDTTEEAARTQIELLRRATVARRFGLTRSLSRSVVELARRAIRRRNPGMSEQEVLLEFVARSYGAELADEVRKALSDRGE